MTVYEKLVDAYVAIRDLENARMWKRVGLILSMTSSVLGVGGVITRSGPVAGLIGLTMAIVGMLCHLQYRAAAARFERWVQAKAKHEP